MALADYLKVTLVQIQEMSLLEFRTWLAYFKVRQQEQEKEAKSGKRADNTRRSR